MARAYWMVINDCGVAGEWWQRVLWTAFLTNGCSIEVYVRADDDRAALANAAFVSVTNNAPLLGVKGRYIEVRVALIRDDASQQPVLNDLTLYGSSPSFAGDLFLDDGWPDETEDWLFLTAVIGPEPLRYQWNVMYPWADQWEVLNGQTNSDLLWTNADLWENGTLLSLSVTNAAGETLVLGPSQLSVFALPIRIPATNYSNGSGPASRYPATIRVRGQPSSYSRVEVTLKELTHYYPADLDILLVSPSGTEIMMMSTAGGSTPITSATLVFHPLWQGKPFPPSSGAIPSNQTSDFSTSNYGNVTQLPGAPAGPYTGVLDNLPDTDPNPNGTWNLYIYDHKPGQIGELHSSWDLEFFY